MKKKIMILPLFLLLTGCSCNIGRIIPSSSHTHEYSGWTTTKEPTCTEPGEEKKVCECGDEVVESITPLEHAFVYRDGLDATCATEGYTSYSECSRCGYTEDYFEIPIDSENHNYSDWIVIEEPTCTELGQKKKVCECGDEVIESIYQEHNYVNGECIICGMSTLTYELSEDGTYYTLKNCDKKHEGTIIIPRSYCDIPVKRIGSYAFDGCNISKIVIPSGVEWLESNAFKNCSKLKSIEIPSSVIAIEDYVFSGCNSLSSINVDNDNPYYKSVEGNLYSKGETTIFKYAQGKIDTSFAIPNSVTTISNGAFSNCDSLLNITIPNSVAIIGNAAFEGCNSLTSMIIPNSVISIGLNAFYGCSSLRFNEYDNALYLGNKNNPYLALISGKDDYITSCEVNDKCKIISGGAFYGYVYLMSINIPNSVTIIEHQAFNECGSLTSVTFEEGSTLKTIRSNVFRSCTGLTNIKIPNSVTTIADAAFYNCSGLTTIELPNSITTIGDYVFYDCSSLSNITIPNSVAIIGDAAFSNCESLINVTIPNSVTTIGDVAFSNCGSLINIAIPNSITSIGEGAFEKCSSLTSITIPKSITIIGSGTFYGCSNLSSVIFEEGSNLTTIGSYAFSICSGLTNIEIPNSVISIGKEAFANCRNLTSITYNGKVEEWNVIEKDAHWDFNIPIAVIHCTDGDVAI